MSTPEGKIKEKCLGWVKDQEQAGVAIHALKLAGQARQRSGESDIVVCYRRIMVVVELKQPGEDYTKLQRHRAEQWAKAGAVIGCAHSREEFVEIVRQVDAQRLSEYGNPVVIKNPIR